MRRKGPSLRSYAAAEAFLAQNLSDLDSSSSRPTRFDGRAKPATTRLWRCSTCGGGNRGSFEAGLLTGQGFIQSSTGLDSNSRRSTDLMGRLSHARMAFVAGKTNR